MTSRVFAIGNEGVDLVERRLLEPWGVDIHAEVGIESLEIN